MQPRKTNSIPGRSPNCLLPPTPRGLGWLGVVGPGVIVLGVSIGSGEFLLGPAAFVKHGLSLLWVTAVAIFLQTIFNTEVMRYIVATGEPVFTGFMRTRAFPHAVGVGLRAVLFPAGRLAGVGGHRGRRHLLSLRGTHRRARGRETVYFIGVGTFLAASPCCSSAGASSARWRCSTGFSSASCSDVPDPRVLFVPGSTWGATALGFVGFDPTTQRFVLLPDGADFFLLGALVAFAGAGGVANIMLANWARDKGYGMGERAGYIPAAVAGKKVNLAHTVSCSSRTPNRWSAGAAGGASCARTSGASSSSARSSGWCCRRCST